MRLTNVQDCKYCSLPDMRLTNVRDSNVCGAPSKGGASLLFSLHSCLSRSLPPYLMRMTDTVWFSSFGR